MSKQSLKRKRKPETITYTIRHEKSIIEQAYANSPDLHKAGKKWLESVAKEKGE